MHDTPKRPFPYSHSRTHSHTATHSLAAADLKLPGTSSKGKQKESEDFHFGWWDFVSLLEPRRPPIQWTSSSLIITAHATEPRVACLHFPSNKHFTLPRPPLISSSPSSYEPPSIITASSRDDLIFAYFPGVDIDGIGCFWRRSSLVDEWVVKDCRTFARGNSVATARWLNPDREWCSSDSGTSVRLPALGPFIPLDNAVLVVVTETHLCIVFYVHPRTEQILSLSALLSRKSSCKEGQEGSNRPIGERVDGPRGMGRVVHAAIGLGYDETSLLISTYSSFVPSGHPETGAQYPSDMNLSLPLPPTEDPVSIPSWETWRDEGVVETCEVNISIEGTHLRLITTPLPAIRDVFQPGRSLTGLTFAPGIPSNNQTTILPSTPTQTHRRVTPQSSPATLPAHVTQSPGRTTLRSPAKPTPPKEKAKSRPPGPLYLICTTLDRGQFELSPSSELISYVYFRSPVEPRLWYLRRVSHLAMPNGVAIHLSPQPSSQASEASALLGVLDLRGRPTKHKGSLQLSVGKLHTLKLPDLQIDDAWESVDIVCPVGSNGVELPFSLAVSPNLALVCGVSSTSLFSFSAKESVGIYQHPRVLHTEQDSVQRTSKQFAGLVETSLHKRVAAGDIVYCLRHSGNSSLDVEVVLSTALSNFEAGDGTFANMRRIDVIGLAIEVYRQRRLSAKSDPEAEEFKARYQTGLEICSLQACNSVWEDTFGNGGYDPDAVWNLISLCGYFVEEFLEKLLKACVQFASEDSIPDGPSDDKKSLPSPASGGNTVEAPFSSNHVHSADLRSSLLHLVHPYFFDTFHSFLQHVRRFRAFLGAHTRSEEHHQVAREILVDTVDSSPIDLEALDRVLSEVRAEVISHADHAPEPTRRSLFALKPLPEHIPLLRKVISKLLQAEVVDKVQLFIKPDDLIDGIVGMSVSPSGKMHERDVITKGYLIGQSKQMTCLRCGGTSEIGVKPSSSTTNGHISIRWAVWERKWLTHCVCGGLWWSRT